VELYRVSITFLSLEHAYGVGKGRMRWVGMLEECMVGLLTCTVMLVNVHASIQHVKLMDMISAHQTASQ
jgi:hypothetical protein